ncbi:MAG TPA: hypothetical protein VFG00_14080 [Acidothermaceae bacterium]|nr:hypothetical protein [Acidothermaceae bacterium]
MSEYCSKHARSAADLIWARYPIGDGVVWCAKGHYVRRRRRSLVLPILVGLILAITLVLTFIGSASANTGRRRDPYQLAFVMETV